MPDRIVINTGPIIAFMRAGVLEVLGRLPMEFICPRQVEDELKAGAALGHPFQWPGGVKAIDLASPLNPLALAALDAGEASVIQLALEQRIDLVCMDERKGRRAALAVGLQVVGSLGLLARAKHLGIIPAVRPITDRLACEGVWFDTELVQRVLRAVGE